MPAPLVAWQAGEHEVGKLCFPSVVARADMVERRERKAVLIHEVATPARAVRVQCAAREAATAPAAGLAVARNQGGAESASADGNGRHVQRVISGKSGVGPLALISRRIIVQ